MSGGLNIHTQIMTASDLAGRARPFATSPCAPLLSNFTVLVLFCIVTDFYTTHFSLYHSFVIFLGALVIFWDRFTLRKSQNLAEIGGDTAENELHFAGKPVAVFRPTPLRKCWFRPSRGISSRRACSCCVE